MTTYISYIFNDKYPLIFLDLTKDIDSRFDYQIQYGCVYCQQYIFNGVLLFILNTLDKDEQDQFSCSPVSKIIKGIIERNTVLTDVQINFCTEALVLFDAKFNNQQLEFILTWKNCD